jgi:hypothetical protein
MKINDLNTNAHKIEVRFTEADRNGIFTENICVPRKGTNKKTRSLYVPLNRARNTTYE